MCTEEELEPREECPVESLQKSADAKVKSRALRRHAFICLQVLRNRYLPFFVSDAILVDLTNEGMKLKFARKIRVDLGSEVWIKVPFSADIDNKLFVTMKAIVQWYDETNFALGVVINSEDVEHKAALERLIGEFVALGRLAS